MALKRQQIIDAVIARMKLINGAGDYYLDLNERVEDNRDTQFAEEECPAINVQDGGEGQTEEKDQELFAGAVNIWYRFLIISIELISNGTLASEDIRKGIADIEKAIGTDLTWGGLAIDTDWLGTTKRRAQDELKIISATVTIRVQFKTTQWAEE